MTPGRVIALVVAAAALAVAAATGTSAPAAPEPAPPPAICRAAPQPSGWPSLAASGPVADLSAYQDYRAGLDIGPGLRGAGVEVADIEYEWRAGHVELAARGLPAAPATGLPSSYQAQEHGTAVLGILGATADGQGVSGLVPDAGLAPVSPFATGVYDPATAIATTAAGLGPGDVLLVELQALQDGSLVPIESIADVRSTIRGAVDRGIVVVEPAGNGNLDIGGIGRSWLTGPTAPNHSGALMVGAGGSAFASDATTDLQRVGGSNFGARVDLQGIGAAVVTSGYGEALGGSENRAYTACFDGTSSASATVAGAVAALQSGAIAKTGSPLSPAAVRALLLQTGLPQADPAGGAIGPRPQVDAALAALSGTPAPPPVDGTPDSGPSTAPSSPAPLTPVIPAVGSSARDVPAVKSISVVLQRRAGRLVIRLKGLARSATVTVAGRKVRVVRGTAVVSRTDAGRLVVKVSAPRRDGVIYSTIRVRVVVPVRGAARVVRI